MILCAVVYQTVGASAVRFFLSLHLVVDRVIEDTNQDGFIQRALNASNAYAGIIEAVERAKIAAKEASNAAKKALEVK